MINKNEKLIGSKRKKSKSKSKEKFETKKVKKLKNKINNTREIKKDDIVHISEESEESSESTKPKKISTRKALNDLANNKQNLLKLSKILNSSKNYDSIKFRDNLYKIGDNLVIDSNEGELIGQLVRIIPTNGLVDYPFWPSIEIRWYYKKIELDRKKNNLLLEKNYNSISNYEVFISTHTDIIYIESIIAKCQILSLEDYQKLDVLPFYTYFTRARYDQKKHILIPKFDKWKKFCICRTPINPDLTYVICDKCSNYFHPECVGLQKNETDKINNYICPICNNIE